MADISVEEPEHRGRASGGRRGWPGSCEADRESADRYRLVVVQLSQRWRIILCRDGIQWILQRRRNAGRRGGEWKSVQYCTTRKALIRVCDASCSPIGPAERAILLNLSNYCGVAR